MKKTLLLLSAMLLFSKVAWAGRGRLDHEGDPFVVNLFLVIGAIFIIAFVILMIKEGLFFKQFEKKEDRGFGCMLVVGVIVSVLFLLSKCS